MKKVLLQLFLFFLICTNALAEIPNVKLPFTPDKTWGVSLGYDSGDHINQLKYSLDFNLSGNDDCNVPLLASYGGKVVLAGWDTSGYGNVVKIKHGNTGYYSLYAHLNKILVIVNQDVTQGQRIGDVGSTGNSSGCHIHFELRGSTQNTVLPEPMSGYSNFSTNGTYVSDNYGDAPAKTYPAFNPQATPIYQWTLNTLAVVDQDKVAHVITDTNSFLAFFSWYMHGCTISIFEFRPFNVNGVNVTNTTGGNLGYQEAINRAYLQSHGFPSSSLVYIPLRGYFSRNGTETWILETTVNLPKMSSTDRAYAQAEIDIAKITLSFQQFPQNNCVNGVPKITFLGANPMKLQKGTAFTEPGYTAMDLEDGNITSNVIISGDTINTSIPGTYVRKYDVSDVQGSHAMQVMRIIQVRENVNEMNTSFITIPNMYNNWKRDLFVTFRYNPQTNLPQLIIMDSQTNGIMKEIGF